MRLKETMAFRVMLLNISTMGYSQSILDFQAGTQIEIQTGTDVCADVMNFQGTVSGGGTRCNMSLTAITVRATLGTDSANYPNLKAAFDAINAGTHTRVLSG